MRCATTPDTTTDMTAAVPRDTASRWAPTLVEPLLALHRRIKLDAELAAVADNHPAWFASFAGGILSDLVSTLPDGDPWRKMSARLGDLTCGERPPDSDGARRPDGRMFGTLDDHLDIIGSVFPDPTMDAALVAVAEPIHPRSAALIGFASHGWKTAQAAVGMLVSMSEPEPTPAPTAHPSRLHLVSPAEPQAPWPGTYQCWLDAVRWTLHRRRSLGVSVDADPWPLESVYRWAWRADRIADGDAWPVDQVEVGILTHRVLRRADDF